MYFFSPVHLLAPPLTVRAGSPILHTDLNNEKRVKKEEVAHIRATSTASSMQTDKRRPIRRWKETHDWHMRRGVSVVSGPISVRVRRRNIGC